MEQVESGASPKDQSYQLSDLEDDEDIEVVTSKGNKIGNPLVEESQEQPSPQPQIHDTSSHERTSSWSTFFKKKEKKDWSKEQEAFIKFKNSAVTTFNQMGQKINEGSQYIYEASKRTAQVTADNLKKMRIFRTPIEAVCKTETYQRPCPRLLLVCCTSIAANGLSTQDIFRREAPEELVLAISGHFIRGSGAVLPPSGATPEVLASVIKKFLFELSEPLLTYRLVKMWIDSGDHPQAAKIIMADLPPANLASFELLLDCLNRISLNSAVNQMDSDALAEAMAPCLLWKFVRSPTPTANQRVTKVTESLNKMFNRNVASSNNSEDDQTAQIPPDLSPVAESANSEASNGSETGRTELSPEELRKLARTISYLITNHKMP